MKHKPTQPKVETPMFHIAPSHYDDGKFMVLYNVSPWDQIAMQDGTRDYTEVFDTKEDAQEFFDRKGYQALNDHFKSNIASENYEQIFNELVPQTGSCNTLEGEYLRAIAKIIYRAYNDGDFYYKGYGVEVAGPSAMFLINTMKGRREYYGEWEYDEVREMLEEMPSPKYYPDITDKNELSKRYRDDLGYIRDIITQTVILKHGNYTEFDGDMLDDEFRKMAADKWAVPLDTK